MRRALGLVVFGAFFVTAHAPAGAQAAPARRWELTLLGGAFNYDAAGDAWSPMVGARVGGEITRFVRAEAGVGYAAVTAEGSRFYQGDGAPGLGADVRHVATPITTAEVGVQLQLPLRHVQPYLGAGYGLFSLDERRVAAADRWAGARLTRASRIAEGGVRLPIGDRLSLRAGLRFRLDTHTNEFDALDVEQVGGIAYRF